jgi:hypothetical protein
LAADCLYSMNFYHTHDVSRGAWQLFQAASGTIDMRDVPAFDSVVPTKSGTGMIGSLGLSSFNWPFYPLVNVILTETLLRLPLNGRV